MVGKSWKLGAVSNALSLHSDLSKGDWRASERPPGAYEWCLSLWVPHLRNMTISQPHRLWGLLEAPSVVSENMRPNSRPASCQWQAEAPHPCPALVRISSRTGRACW